MSKLAAAAATDVPQTPPKPRGRFFLFGGLGMVAAGAALLYFFVKDPMGTLPGFPQVWKGGPLLLGACFLGVYGALLLILKRFSLGSMLLAAILSAALTGGVHAYVYSFRESETREVSFYLPPEKLKTFLERSRNSLTGNRLTSFVLDMHAQGYLKDTLDFDEIDIRFGVGGENDWEQSLKMKFSWSPYVHPKRTDTQKYAVSYARLVNAWNVLRSLGIELNASQVVQQSLLFAHRSDSGFRYLNPNRLDFAVQKESFKSHLDGLVFDLYIIKFYGLKSNQTSEQLLVDSATWLAEREPDPELKAFLEQVRDEIKRGREVKPVRPQSVSPTKYSNVINLGQSE